MGATTVLRGPLIRLTGSPFEQGDGALVHEADGALTMQGGLIVAVGPAADMLAPTLRPRSAGSAAPSLPASSTPTSTTRKSG